MSIAYVGYTQAKPGQAEALRELFATVVVPAVRGSAGCESCQFFQSEDDPTRFVGIETWASVQDHRAAIKNIPSEAITEFMTLVAGAPSGGYYRSV
jgi:quinol monooxygenase YgiN